MGSTVTVAAAQTGPVLTDDMRKGVESACRLVEQAAASGVEITCFSELFLTPFFPNRLTQGYEHYFISEVPNATTRPLFDLAREKHMGLIFPFGEKRG